ncbi:hypothetical protein Stsp02_22770 [Streptomyces sp. NBRC 14336]|uniref:hypothetical protein n=1 Tax=Streptomyces sp. NBRC 14336 TaxID=3030992 RepID=UPI0024A1AA28|nr:hypothetical protein [Streptomyces sp. NBRC 14336]GLW46615.1 hypothetical protein Stsp02_22770 [Streptomyces sp. NBRC 14336]
MRDRITTVAVLAALTLTACSSEDSDGQADAKPNTAISQTAAAAAGDSTDGYDSAQDISNALKDAGLTVSAPEEDTDASYITEVGGTSYTFTVTDQDEAASDAGINMFPNPEALAAWIPLSKQFGGVAVTGDTWAVSLPTRDKAARDDSKRLAPKVAEALNGTVQQ